MCHCPSRCDCLALRPAKLLLQEEDLGTGVRIRPVGHVIVINPHRWAKPPSSRVGRMYQPGAAMLYENGLKRWVYFQNYYIKTFRLHLHSNHVLVNFFFCKSTFSRKDIYLRTGTAEHWGMWRKTETGSELGQPAERGAGAADSQMLSIRARMPEGHLGDQGQTHASRCLLLAQPQRYSQSPLKHLWVKSTGGDHRASGDRR